jgi:uncharacterized damage-inducible protein DinB
MLIETILEINPMDVIKQEWQGKTVEYRAIALLIQIINHGVEHRTNITTFLDKEQLAPPGVDGWSYLWAHLERLGGG